MNPKYTDAYHTLGLREGASPEEIRSAFESLEERFSETAYLGSPLWDVAAEKRKKIRAAYDLLIGKQEENGPAEASGEEADGKESAVAAAETTASDLNPQERTEGFSLHCRVRELLNQNDPDGAEALLAAQPDADTDPELVFLRGMTAWKRGWLDEAAQLTEKAVQLAPDNSEYRTWMDKVRSGPSTAAGSRLMKNAGDIACGACGWCTCECCADVICESICDSIC